MCLLTRPTSCRQTGHTHGFPCPESTQIFQQVLSKMCPQRSSLIGNLSVPIRGMPKLSTRFSFFFCGSSGGVSSYNCLFVVSKDSRHMGHCGKIKIKLDQSIFYPERDSKDLQPLSETLFAIVGPFLSLICSFYSFVPQKRTFFFCRGIHPTWQRQM